MITMSFLNVAGTQSNQIPIITKAHFPLEFSYFHLKMKSCQWVSSGSAAENVVCMNYTKSISWELLEMQIFQIPPKT